MKGYLPDTKLFLRKASGPDRLFSRKTSASSISIMAFQDAANVSQCDSLRSISSSSVPISATVRERRGVLDDSATHSEVKLANESVLAWW